MGVAPSGSLGYRSASSFSAWALMSAPAFRSSSARPGPCLGMSSSITLRIRQATGFRSLAKASQPSLRASRGMDPPPAKGSTTRGVCSGWAAWTSPRLVSKYSSLAELSQLAKSAIELEQDLAESFVGLDGGVPSRGPCPHGEEEFSCLPFELLGPVGNRKGQGAAVP